MAKTSTKKTTTAKKATKATKPEMTSLESALNAPLAKATKKKGGGKKAKAATEPAPAPVAYTTETWPGGVFATGEYYENTRGDLFYCNGMRDDGKAVLMTPAPEGNPVGEATMYDAGDFTRYLEPAAVVEHREACQHEREAEAETARRNAGLGEDPALRPATTETAAEPKAPKAPRKPREPKAPGKMSCLDAAAQVLRDAGQPLGAKDMIERMATAGLWTSPGGATPHSTLYAAIIREIAKKGADARFAKTDRGLFTAATTTPTDAAPATDEATPTETPAAE